LFEQELLTLPKHRSSPPVFSDVRVVQCVQLHVFIFLCPLQFPRKTDIAFVCTLICLIKRFTFNWCLSVYIM